MIGFKTYSCDDPPGRGGGIPVERIGIQATTKHLSLYTVDRSPREKALRYVFDTAMRVVGVCGLRFLVRGTLSSQAYGRLLRLSLASPTTFSFTSVERIQSVAEGYETSYFVD